MPEAHRFDGRPWWDDGPHPLHREDGTRIRFRIQYHRIPLHPEFGEACGLHGLYHWDPTQQLAARRKLWRRLRTGFYERNESTTLRGPEAATEPVPLCGAKCRDGHACRARAVMNPVTGKRSRCRKHGGKSCGAKTSDGRARSLAALARGRETRARNCRLKRQQSISGPGTVPPESYMGTESAS